MGVGQTLDDYARILANGFTFGGADKIAHAITGNDEAAATAAARQRQGLGGDIADVAPMLVTGGGALKALTKVPAAIRAAPAVAEYVPAALRAARVGLADLGGPGLTRAETAARLGINYVPTLAERALGAVGTGVGKAVAYPFQHPIMSALAAAGGLAEYAHRNNAGATTTAHAAPVPQAAPDAATQPSVTGNYQDAVPPEIAAAAKQAAGGGGQTLNPSFSDLAAQVAAANGGKISLRALGTLADIAYKTAPRQAPEKPPTPAEIAQSRGLALGEQYYNSKLKSATSQQEADKAYEKLIELYGQIGKSRPTDPLAGYGLPDDGG